MCYADPKRLKSFSAGCGDALTIPSRGYREVFEPREGLGFVRPSSPLLRAMVRQNAVGR